LSPNKRGAWTTGPEKKENTASVHTGLGITLTFQGPVMTQNRLKNGKKRRGLIELQGPGFWIEASTVTGKKEKNPLIGVGTTGGEFRFLFAVRLACQGKNQQNRPIKLEENHGREKYAHLETLHERN